MLSDDIKYLYRSNLFNPTWYSQQYPDVTASGYSPEQHFLELGAALRRSPSAEFDTAWYLRRYPDVATSGMNPLMHYLRYGRAEGRAPRELPGEHLENALWRGEYWRGALRGLWALLTHDDVLACGQAAWALARWYASQEQWSRVVHAMAVLSPDAGRYPHHPGPWLLEVEALRQVGRRECAFLRLDTLKRHFPSSDEWLLALVNFVDDRSSSGTHAFQQRLEGINRCWVQAGLTNVVAGDDATSLDDLVSTEPAEPPRVLASHQPSGMDLPLVTVIVPVYNAQATLVTALSSLQAQSYPNLEVLVVDDASTDSSRDVARRFAHQDERFRLLAQVVNSGVYSARNAGLAVARGELITVHDSDDWSHPQKIARQVEAMHELPGVKACLTDWVRCADDLTLMQWRMDTSWALENLSSLMFRRQVVEELGYWDRVRVSGDREYVNRIKAAYGEAAVCKVASGIPLALGRYRLTSLTQMSTTRLFTMFRGLRYDYNRAAQAWHRLADTLYLPCFPQCRPFPAPMDNLVKNGQGVDCQ